MQDSLLLLLGDLTIEMQMCKLKGSSMPFFLCIFLCPIDAYFKSSGINIVLPCNLCRVVAISGITELGCSINGLMGGQIYQNLLRLPAFALSAKYELKPYTVDGTHLGLFLHVLYIHILLVPLI
jgi:hypothetical protein